LNRGAIVELKRRNPRFGCPRIALTITNIVGIDIDKNVVRRVLAKLVQPEPEMVRFVEFAGSHQGQLVEQ